MDMKAVHQQAIAGHQSTYHQFLLRYQKGGRVVYGFVEGKTDPSFYRSAVESVIPDGWSVDLMVSGSKSATIDLHGALDWRRFDWRRVIFFIDRDHSGFTNDQLPLEDNVYITDYYSVESTVCCQDVAVRYLKEACGLHGITADDERRVRERYDWVESEFFGLIEVISCMIIFYRITNQKPNLNNLKIGKIFNIEDGRVKRRTVPAPYKTLLSYLPNVLGTNNSGIRGALPEIMLKVRDSPSPKLHCRGKYQAWMFCAFIADLIGRPGSTLRDHVGKVRCSVPMGEKNVLVVAGPRCRRPISLDKFLAKTVLSYIEG